MEQADAIRCLHALRERIAEVRSKPNVGYADFEQLQHALLNAAHEIFGPDSSEKKDAEVRALAPDRLKRLERQSNRVTLIHTENRVARIMKPPKLAQTNYYRKRLDELSEVITSMLFSLEKCSGLPSDPDA